MHLIYELYPVNIRLSSHSSKSASRLNSHLERKILDQLFGDFIFREKSHKDI